MRINLADNARLSFSSLWAHRFRSLLTILGIVIGITTVVTVASLLTGLRQGIVDFFEELGPDSVFVYRTSGDPNQVPDPKEDRRRLFSPEYADFILNSSRRTSCSKQASANRPDNCSSNSWRKIPRMPTPGG